MYICKYYYFHIFLVSMRIAQLLLMIILERDLKTCPRLLGRANIIIYVICRSPPGSSLSELQQKT